MGVAEKFSKFNSNIRISDVNIVSISSRYKRITKQLNKDFRDLESETAYSLYVGSYGRDTDIHVSDVDMIYQLPYEVYEQYNGYSGNGQSALLQAVRSSLQNTYSSTFIKGDGQVIGVNFTDGINFEIVPCFINKDDSYTFPNSNDGGSWKITDPKPEIEAIKNANELWNYNLKRLCRMTRAWKDEWDVPMGGLLIDTLAYNFLKNWEHKDKSFLYYDYMTRNFFEFLKNQDEKKSYWLAPGSNQQVRRIGLFEYKAKVCFNIAVDAVNYESNNQSSLADSEWEDIFGSKFTG